MEVLKFAHVEAWDAWLEQHHDSAPEAWLRIRRKNADLQLITISNALDGALCHGWIDGTRRALDDVSFLQRYSRRRPRTAWSQVNVAKAEALEAAPPVRHRAAAAQGQLDQGTGTARDAVCGPAAGKGRWEAVSHVRI